jgi:hypothetical protein
MKALYDVALQATQELLDCIKPSTHKHSVLCVAPSKLVMCSAQEEHGPNPASDL